MVSPLNGMLHWENVASMWRNYISGLSYWPNLVAIWLIGNHIGNALGQDGVNLGRPCCHHVGPFSNKLHGINIKMAYRAIWALLTLVARDIKTVHMHLWLRPFECNITFMKLSVVKL